MARRKPCWHHSPPRRPFEDRSGAAEWAEQRQQQRLHVKNTFIDVCPLEEESNDGDEASEASPHRRNASAPPSPTRNRNSLADSGDFLDDSDQEVEEDPSSIPVYEWAAHGGLVSADGVDNAGDSKAPQADLGPPSAVSSVWGDSSLPFDNGPPWLKLPPGSPKKVPSRQEEEDNERGGHDAEVLGQRPGLGELLKTGSLPFGQRNRRPELPSWA
jgi:hypothetical protein